MQNRHKQSHYIPLLKVFLRSQPKYVRSDRIVQKWCEKYPEFVIGKKGEVKTEIGVERSMGLILSKILKIRANSPNGKVFENVYSEV